jgi:hypothetical protein
MSYISGEPAMGSWLHEMTVLWNFCRKCCTQAIFWIVCVHLMFPGLFYDQSYLVHYYFPLSVLVSLSLVQTKGQIKVIYMEDLWGRHSLSKLSASHSSNIRICIHIKLKQNIIICHNALTQKHGLYWRKWQKTVERVSESMVAVLKSYGSKNVRSGRVCVFVTWDANIMLQGFIPFTGQVIRTAEKCMYRILRMKHRNSWPIDNAWHSNHVFVYDPMAKC